MFNVPFNFYIYYDFNERIFVETVVILIVVCSSAATYNRSNTRYMPFRATCEYKFVSN